MGCVGNNCLGVIHTAQCTAMDHYGAGELKKRDCQKMYEQGLEWVEQESWLSWLATKGERGFQVERNYKRCQSLQNTISTDTYIQLRDKLVAHDLRQSILTGEEAWTLRNTVREIEQYYEGDPIPRVVASANIPGGYRSPEEQEYAARFGNNIAMSVLPITAAGILPARALGATEQQAAAAGELALAFGGLAALRSARPLQPRAIREDSRRGVQHDRPPGTVIVRPRPGVLSGRRTQIKDRDDEATRRSLQRENDAADALTQRHGYSVEQNPSVSGNKNPDYKISGNGVNGEIYDAYSPSTSNVRNIADQIGVKVSTGQANNIVVNLADSNATASALRNQLTNHPIPGLNNVLILDKSGGLSIFNPTLGP
jgi:Contact-dependent growth inhibition CdiA C-terminal domain